MLNNPNNLILPGVPLVGGSQPTLVIQAVLTDEERARLLDALREIVREELALALKKPEPSGVIIANRYLREDEIAVLRKSVRDYDGSMPFAEYLEKWVSPNMTYVVLDEQEGEL